MLSAEQMKYANQRIDQIAREKQTELGKYPLPHWRSKYSTPDKIEFIKSGKAKLRDGVENLYFDHVTDYFVYPGEEDEVEKHNKKIADRNAKSKAIEAQKVSLKDTLYFRDNNELADAIQAFANMKF